MLFSKLATNKFNKYLIEDPGYCFGGNYDEVTLINNKNNNENLILQYLRLIKTINQKTQEIQELETRRKELSNEIMSNPELKESLEKLLSENIKTK